MLNKRDILKLLISVPVFPLFGGTSVAKSQKERQKTMKLKIERYASNSVSTAGKLFIGGLQVCVTLEDEHRDIKVYGNTRIPAGIYKLGLRTEGGFHIRYKTDPRFSMIHKGMIEVLNVPNFSYILFHCGNTHKHTAGCILLGTTIVTKYRGRPDEEFQISQSTKAYKHVYSIIADALLQKEEITLEMIDMD